MTRVTWNNERVYQVKSEYKLKFPLTDTTAIKIEKQFKDLIIEELLSKNIIIDQYENTKGMVCFKIYDLSRTSNLSLR